MQKTLIITGILALCLTACSPREDRSLMNIRSTGEGPDEFALVPNKPLTIPADLTDLPPPSDAAQNRVTLDPMGDAVAALGGNPAVARSGGARGGEQALLNAAGRFGVNDNIRSELSAADEAFRKGKFVRPLERVARTNVYGRIYQDFSLDAYAELQRLRNLGVQTPTAPPNPDQ